MHMHMSTTYFASFNKILRTVPMLHLERFASSESLRDCSFDNKRGNRTVRTLSFGALRLFIQTP